MADLGGWAEVGDRFGVGCFEHRRRGEVIGFEGEVEVDGKWRRG
ncbi:hypothetical protein [Mycobacterium riyadhense]|nr:hypothetical protein [Mycobacterium riyadhense]